MAFSKTSILSSSSTTKISSTPKFASSFATEQLSLSQLAFLQSPFNLTPIIGPAVTRLPPTPVPAPEPASPTANASDLQVMISAIPIAQDGHVITADYHNALRLALVAIANRMGIGPVSEEITVTNAPRLLPVAGMAQWAHDYGIVRKPATLDPSAATRVSGWMELELPDGARIKKMHIFGTAAGGGLGALTIKLKRQKITNPTPAIDLIVIEVPDGNDASKGLEGDVTDGGTGVGKIGIEELRIVNNREQKYLLAVELLNLAATAAQLNAIQIVLGE